jgi:hypothetical protein
MLGLVQLDLILLQQLRELHQLIAYVVVLLLEQLLVGLESLTLKQIQLPGFWFRRGELGFDLQVELLAAVVVQQTAKLPI